MQSRSSSRSFKPGLIGASPITDAILLSRCNESLHAGLRSRRFVVQIHVRAPSEVRVQIAQCKMSRCHASLCILKSALEEPPCLSSTRVPRLRDKPVFVGASPTRGSSLRLPATARQASLNGDHDVTVASRPVKAFVPVRIRLVTPISMGRKLQVILHAKGRSLAMRERPDESPGRVRVPQRRSPPCGITCPS